MFCQLEILRRCLPPSIRRSLEELPESLDETYERVLREIKKPNRDLAHRLLQCLVVAIRPLRVEELAEVLAVDFDDGEGTAKLNPSWRWEDHEQALLSSCSSLVSIVKNVSVDGAVHSHYGDTQNDNSLVVQFSHFSVKEFLTSPRLASPSRDVSHYHIFLEPAHMILAQACLGVLLRLDDGGENDSGNSSPLAGYAASHWVAHAKFKDVSSRVHIAMERLFDPERPCFAAWLRLYDMDAFDYTATFVYFYDSGKYGETRTPLYYAALCGFKGLVEHLIAKWPDHVKVIGGRYQTATVAALSGRHFELARLLHRNGSSADPPGHAAQSPLLSAACSGDLEMVEVLLDCDADVNSRSRDGTTPLYAATYEPHPQTLHIVRLLLEHGANPNLRDDGGIAPLHCASFHGNVEVVRLLLKYGADVGPEDKEGKTPFQKASEGGHYEVSKLLLDHSARRIQ